MAWKKIYHCEWRDDKGNRIVKQYKPCKGGIVFVLLKDRKLSYWRSLEDALKEAGDGESVC